MFKKYLLRFFLKLIIVIAFLVILFVSPNLLDYENNPITIPLILYWLVLMIDFVIQLFPNKFTFLGVERQFSKYYQSNGTTLSDHPNINIKRLNLKALLVAVLWIGANVGLIYLMKLLNIFSVPAMVVLSSLYYLGDLICVLLWCPFQSFFIKSKCCHDCRIYNLGNLMMVTPLCVVINQYSFPLLLMALIIFIAWEVKFYFHPERFFEETNNNLKCANCSEKMCKIKKPYHLKRSKK